MKVANKNPIFSLRLAPEILKIISDLSKEMNVTRTDVIRMAIVEYNWQFAQHKKKRQL